MVDYAYTRVYDATVRYLAEVLGYYESWRRSFDDRFCEETYIRYSQSSRELDPSTMLTDWRQLGNDRDPFIFAVQQVMWQLVVVGFVVPTKGCLGYGDPFQITQYGKSALASPEHITIDPLGFTTDIAALSDIDATAKGYIQEAVRCYWRQCHIAAVSMVGIANESIFDQIYQIVQRALDDTRLKSEFEKKTGLKGRAEKLKTVFQTKRSQASDAEKEIFSNAQTVLLNIIDLIRVTRNELIHPKLPPTVDNSFALAQIMLAVSVARRANETIAYFRVNSIP